MLEASDDMLDLDDDPSDLTGFNCNREITICRRRVPEALQTSREASPYEVPYGVAYAVRVQRRKASDRLGMAWRRDYNTNDVRVKSVTAGSSMSGTRRTPISR